MDCKKLLSKFHWFVEGTAGIGVPEKFTYPFCYEPHPLCVRAAEEVKGYLAERKEWQEELQEGKMFGVLVVEDKRGEIGFLAAFSGLLAGRNVHDYFVPPIYDLQEPDGFFRAEEEEISGINERIGQLEGDGRLRKCRAEAERVRCEAERVLTEVKRRNAEAREVRRQRRAESPTEEEMAQMVRESQYEKAELRRLKQRWEEEVAGCLVEVERFTVQIQALKEERKRRSAALQRWLFERFDLLNARGGRKNLYKLFQETEGRMPPAGAGECAAPRLLQYAYLYGLRPVAMAEFWWGNSPSREIRRHGNYYPACQGKCGPILRYMLQGLNVEANPLEEEDGKSEQVEILYEDECLWVVNKPAGMLTVPGKSKRVSLWELLRRRLPEEEEPLVVHRLDMATSGVLVMAKTKEAHKDLQAQFKTHEVKKRYVALLEGVVTQDEGVIDLPLCLDPENRPYQIVNETYGKKAITRYQVTERRGNRTRISFYPLTGRTHQLRVHAAHPRGLNAPIVGDMLYGCPAGRLYLHAAEIEFRHPLTDKKIIIIKDADF
ncbi:pseudouridine synthase [Odoribacter lunatus]|uniref:pseudouridine synthase n=1 Tax=Odoribacter lunatus TaxID=2941335 RepID=UPI00203E472B|nr:pseudouridine synthase [Odoribacter lunatus]